MSHAAVPALDANEIALFRDNVRKFLEKEVAPFYNQWEKDEIFPRTLWNKLGEIAKDLGIKSEGWHRALADVEMTSKIFDSFLASEGAVCVADIGKRR